MGISMFGNILSGFGKLFFASNVSDFSDVRSACSPTLFPAFATSNYRWRSLGMNNKRCESLRNSVSLWYTLLSRKAFFSAVRQTLVFRSGVSVLCIAIPHFFARGTTHA
jgi:hypothetical protein